MDSSLLREVIWSQNQLPQELPSIPGGDFSKQLPSFTSFQLPSSKTTSHTLGCHLQWQS